MSAEAAPRRAMDGWVPGEPLPAAAVAHEPIDHLDAAVKVWGSDIEAAVRAGDSSPAVRAGERLLVMARLVLGAVR